MLRSHAGRPLIGELSTSVRLESATAVMGVVSGEKMSCSSHQPLIDGGSAWLACIRTTTAVGATTMVISNISTTMLCRSAIYLTDSVSCFSGSPYPGGSLGSLPNTALRKNGSQAIRQRYGKDRTFATPILTTPPSLACIVGFGAAVAVSSCVAVA